MAHNDTVFAQVLKLVPRHEFESLARKHKSGRMSRSMTRWGQFVAMGMAQLTGRCSLRDIVSNLAAQSCKLYHLGVGVVTRSSLARVNAEKPWEMYEELHGRGLPQNLWVERRAGSPRQTHSVPVCSPPSRRVAPLRPRCAGLTAWTPAARTSVPALV